MFTSAEQAADRFSGEDKGYIYSRYGNPTVSLFERRLAALEGTERCVALSSGMAAMYAALACQLRAGDHIVASRALFGSCLQVITSLLPRHGITYTLVDGTDLSAWEAAVSRRRVCSSAKPRPIRPLRWWISRPSALLRARRVSASWSTTPSPHPPSSAPPQGADVVTYSATKHIDGQGGVWAAPSAARKLSTRNICSSSSATPGRASAPSTRGRWQSRWRPSICACHRWRATPPRSPASSKHIRASSGCLTRACPATRSTRLPGSR